jgi:hypothetical protein
MCNAQSLPLAGSTSSPNSIGTVEHVAFLSEALHVRIPCCMMVHGEQSSCYV